MYMTKNSSIPINGENVDIGQVPINPEPILFKINRKIDEQRRVHYTVGLQKYLST